MTEAQRSYLPAAGRDWALPLYDPLVKAIGGGAARARLIDQAKLGGAKRILDVGCGTGTLLVQIARQFPGIEATGIDPDPLALARAGRKAAAAHAAVRLDRGFSDALPYPDGSFDRVLSSFMFHHLGDGGEKQRTLEEIRRVLAPGGSLHLLDFSHPKEKAGGLMQKLHSNHRLDDLREDRVLSLMCDAGFADPMLTTRGRMFFVLHTAYYRSAA